MPIETRCPGCQKVYRLKDELGGKSVKCSNAECRHVFVIPAAQNGKVKPTGGKQAKPAVDAEALAAQLFSEEADTGPAGAERQLPVECFNCNHQWTEPESKAGKFTLCPECRTRIKVPELVKKKAADWRDASGGRRLLEKGPDLPADLEEQRLKEASIKSLVDAGAIEAPEVEPRPLREWILLACVPLVLIGLAAGGVFWWIKSGEQGAENAAMAETVKTIDELSDDSSPIPAADRQLMRAALHLANGEYQARLNTKEGIREAVKAFANARRELAAVPKKEYERDPLFADLAVAQLALGGTDAQADAEVRLRWTPQGVKAPPVGSSPVDYVQNELRQTLTKMAEREVDKGIRLATVVRLTRNLCEAGHPDVLFEIVTQGFAPEDHLEAQSLMLFVALQNGAPEDKVRRLSEQIKSQLKADEAVPAPWPSLALFDKLGFSDYKPPIPAPVEGTAVPLTTRLAYGTLALSQNKTADAVELVTGFGRIADRVPAMTALAELLPDPGPVLDKAAEAGKEIGRDFRFYAVRLAKVAADVEQPGPAEAFAAGISDDGLREWATAVAAGAKWAAMNAVVPPSDLTFPTDPASLRVGHGWAAMQLARHNAVVSGDRKAGKAYDGWGDGKLRGFGYAGLALGLQSDQ